MTSNRRFLVFLLSASTLSTAAAQWVQTQGPTGGSISVVYSNGTVLFTASPGGGIFVSSNNGAGWAPANSGFGASMKVESFASLGTTMYLSGATGVYSSVNNGNTWDATGLSGGHVYGLGAKGQTLVGGLYDSGIFVSTDAGITWKNVKYTNNPVQQFVFSGPNVFGCGVGINLLSTDGGMTWNGTTVGFPSASHPTLALIGSTVYAGADSGLYRSTDNGLTWSRMAFAGTRVYALAGSGSTLISGTAVGVYRSTNSGTIWALANTQPGSQPVQSLATQGGLYFAGTPTGMYVSSDNGVNWAPRNAGFANTLVSRIASSRTALCSATAPGPIYSTTDQGSSWTGRTSPRPTVRTICFIDTVLFAATDSGVYRSTDNGGSWTIASVGLTNLSIRSLNSSGTTLYAGTDGGVFRSTTYGSSWSVLGSGLASASVSYLAQSGNTYLAGTSSGVYFSTNSGTTWSQTSVSPPYGPNALAVNTYGFFVGTVSGVYVSTDRGSSWHAANSGLPASYPGSSVSDLLSAGGSLIAATGYGVFASTDNGNSWLAENTSTNSVAVNCLAASGGVLYVGTNGQGVWRRPLSEMLPVFSPNPSGFNLGIVVIGRHPVNTLEVRNPGVLPLNITSVQTLGDSEFSISPTSGIVQPADSMKFYVTFTPVRVTYTPPADHVSFQFNDNSYDSPQYVGASGLVFDSVFKASTYNISFPGIQIGSSLTDTIKVTNYPMDPGDVLTIYWAWCSDSLAYSVTPKQLSIPQMGTAAFRIAFHPYRAGEARGNVLFYHTSGGYDTIAVDGFGLPPQPALNSPPDLAINQSRSLQLQWTALSGTDSYHVQLARDSLFLQLVVNDSLVTAATKNVTGLDTSTTFYWRVRGKNGGGWGNYSAFSRFTTVPLAPDAPQLAFPQDSAKNLSRPVLVQWLASARGVQYRLRVSLASDLSSPMLDTVITGLSFPLSTLDPDQTYYWGVTARNPGGDSPLSTVRSFRTVPGAPASPVLYLPPNNATDQALALRLIWHRTNKTDSYEVKLSDTLSFTRLLIDTVVVDTFLTAGALRNQQSFYWTVTSRNAGGASSPVQAFTFATVPFPPPAPTLVLPADKDSTQPKDVDLRWNVVTGSTGYHVQLSNDPTIPPPNPVVNDSILTNAVTRHVAGLTAGQIYYWRVRAKNSGGWGDFTANRSFYVAALPQPPALQSPADKTNSQDPNSASFGWNDVGAARYHLRIALNSSLSNPVLDDSMITLHTRSVSGLACNSTYYWTVRAIASNGLASDFTKPLFSFSTVASKSFVNATVSSFPASSPASTDYRLVSFPGGSGWLVNQVLPNGTQGVDWRVYRDNGGTPPNHLTELNSSATLNPGEGFWLLHLGLMEFTQNVTMPALDSIGTFPMQVRSGWNLIGNPFGVPIPWTAVMSANGNDSLPPPSTWNGKYETVTSLNPFKGNYFYNRFGALTTLRIPYPFSALQKLAPTPRPMNWRIDIAASISGHETGVTWLGISPAAREGYNVLNEYHPPVILDQPDLFFLRPAWDSVYSRFGSDVRPKLDEGQVWSFEVQGKRMSASSLKFSGVSGVPAGNRIVLINMANIAPLDVLEKQEYPFVMTADRMSFRLIVGKPAFVEQEILNVMPKEYRLDQNFPNPFNPSTTITFELPKASDVELEIVSLLGQRVSILVQGFHTAGRYSVIWDAGEGGSRSFASGVYFARLKVNGTAVGVRKMMLLK